MTEPFKSSLDFPGAIFVGIHNDGSPDGLAATVQTHLPEDSILVDLDTGEIDCADKQQLIVTAWDVIPHVPRSALVSELQILCRDASIMDGQEPLDSQFDSAFDVSLTAAVDDFGVSTASREPLDDRAVRDSFLRFFCAVMGGYDSFLIPPDADFKISGNEWFDTAGFVKAASSSRARYLEALVNTQLFQAFIQKRTEASDVRCLLFDECLSTYHMDAKPYGRLGADVESLSGKDQPPMLYSLLVDQAATLPDQSIISSRSTDASDTESSLGHHTLQSANGDLVTTASLEGLPLGKQYVYCVDGSPCFPLHLDHFLFLPSEPECWDLAIPQAPNPLLARSEKELEDATRQRKKMTSGGGMQQQRRCLWQLPKLMGSHFLGAWLLCVPARVSFGNLSHEQQTKFFLQALGALRGLRSKQRIVPDEAGYRALMVACGRTDSDRRLELVKLWGLLRSDGIFPSSVTLGQYTRALAEGYSRTQSAQERGQEVETGSRIGRMSVASLSWRGEPETSLTSVDGYLIELESHGRQWRQKSERGEKAAGDTHSKKKRINRPWLPVVFSSSFLPTENKPISPRQQQDVHLFAIWSRTCTCDSCGYIPLDEEIQAGWNVSAGGDDPAAVACAKCSAMIVPMLAYRKYNLEDAIEAGRKPDSANKIGQRSDLPPQLQDSIDVVDESTEYVTYLSPDSMRLNLEQLVEANGEEVLIRDRLLEDHPVLFANLWWYCARFSLPLPLPVVQYQKSDPVHFCAFAAWEESAALRGCASGAKALLPFVQKDGVPGESSSGTGEVAPVDPFDDVPILSRYNLQGFHSNVWDEPYLSQILVTLVEACDKKDFRPVVEAATRAATKSDDAKEQREVDIYRTILYLAKYQCTSAFHSFFPATIKACKGYHYWVCWKLTHNAS